VERRPLVATSKEYVEIPLDGPDVASLAAADLEISVAPSAGPFGAWAPASGYDPVTAVALALVGPGTPLGQLPVGWVRFRVRITDAPEVPILDAGGLEIIT
jgi:hypothetical protein